jgi:hypothetical protein
LAEGLGLSQQTPRLGDDFWVDQYEAPGQEREPGAIAAACG